VTITREPTKLSPLAEAGLVLVSATPHLGRYLAEIRCGSRVLDLGSAEHVYRQLTLKAGAVRRHKRPAHCRQAAATWVDAEMADRASAAQEIIDAALAAGKVANV